MYVIVSVRANEKERGRKKALRAWDSVPQGPPCVMWWHCLPMEQIKKDYGIPEREGGLLLRTSPALTIHSLRLAYQYSQSFPQFLLSLFPRSPAFLLFSCLTSETMYKYFPAAGSDGSHLNKIPNTNIQASKRKNLRTQIYCNITPLHWSLGLLLKGTPLLHLSLQNINCLRSGAQKSRGILQKGW